MKPNASAGCSAMKRAFLLALLACGCQSIDEKVMVDHRGRVAQYAREGFLPSFATEFFEADGLLERASKPIDGQKPSVARKAIREEAARLVATNWEAVRAAELGFARNPKKSEAAWLAENAVRMTKLFTALGEVDASLPGKWNALCEERAKIEAEGDAATAVAEAASAKGKVLFWTEGFEDSDLESCVRKAIEPLTKGEWFSRRGRPSDEAIAAAAQVIHFKAEVIWTAYSSRSGGRVEARVPSQLAMSVELDVPKQKRRSWSVEVGAENPESISAGQGNSARGVAAGLMGTQIAALYEQGCGALRAKIGR